MFILEAPIRTNIQIKEILNKENKINNIPSSNEIFVTNANIDNQSSKLQSKSIDEGIKSLLTGIISELKYLAQVVKLVDTRT